MFKLLKRLFHTCTVFLMVMPLVSCGGGGSGTAGTTGTLSIGLTDAPAGYDAIYVTIEEISVHHEVTGWETILTLIPVQTLNLLDLVGGDIHDLGVAELKAGHYNQMRLKLSTEHDDAQNIREELHKYANYLIFEGERAQIELKVPSGLQTGIKLVNGFDIIASGSTELFLDFDALRSVVQAGNSEQWLLKPTIKVLETLTNSVSGTVMGPGVDAPLVGASISAQLYDSGAGEVTGGVAGTFSEEGGAYFMYLPVNRTNSPYNIVAMMTVYEPEIVVYEPQCQELVSTDTANYTNVNFTSLTPADTTGTLTGSVTGLAASTDSATFSIRQVHTSCGMIEVASSSVVNTISSDPLDLIYFEPITLPVLPVGEEYEVVVSASVEGVTTQVFDVEVADGGDAVLDVDFTPPPAP
jgi:hypothetical protein